MKWAQIWRSGLAARWMIALDTTFGETHQLIVVDPDDIGRREYVPRDWVEAWGEEVQFVNDPRTAAESRDEEKS